MAPPEKKIVTQQDVETWASSETHKELVGFLEALAAAVKGMPSDALASEPTEVPEVITKLHKELLEPLDALAWAALSHTYVPPGQGAAASEAPRFGNYAFRNFCDEMQPIVKKGVAALLDKIFPKKEEEGTKKSCGEATPSDNDDDDNEVAFPQDKEQKGEQERQPQREQRRVLGLAREEAEEELAVYLSNSFGDRMRIDYGTGHELNFACFMLCLSKLGVLTRDAYKFVVLQTFVKYLDLVRNIQQLFRLEPAGSRGVWGLDDYHFLPFLFGASQMIGQAEVTPAEAVKKDVIHQYCNSYLYLEALRRIIESKSNMPLAECSPMLYDISGVPTWTKIAGGMVKMYKAEVLAKVAVMQHFFFGKLLPWPEAT